MQNKIIVITGANSGIGKASALTLARQGGTIVMVCRDAQKGEAARQELITQSNNSNIVLELCDFSSQASIHASGRAFAQKYPRIDVLLNNAGAIFGSRQVSADGLEMTFAVNHIGYFLWTHYLLGSLRAAERGRIVNVASLAHTFVWGNIPWDDLQWERRTYRQFGTYGLSKLCNILFSNELAARLRAEGSPITVNSLHPGTIATNFGQSGGRFFGFLVRLAKPFLKSPDTGSKTSVYLATSPAVEGVTGTYFDNCRPKKTSRLAANPDHARRLWDISMRLTGLKEYGKIDE